MTLGDYLESAKKSLFRYEYLQEFNVRDEPDQTKFFKEIGVLKIMPKSPWYNMIRDYKKKGVKMNRVRRIEYPMNLYTEWELYTHFYARALGDNISCVSNKIVESLNLPENHDFWIIDDKTVLKMKYTEDGAYIGIDIIEENIESYLETKKILLENNISIEEALDKNN